MKPEEIECQAFSQWLHFQGLKHAHIANEVNWGGAKNTVKGRRDAAIVGAKLKRLGKSPGVPDYLILTEKGIIFIEMKTPGSKLKQGDPLTGWSANQHTRGGLSRDQKDWIDAIRAVPLAQAEVAYSAEEAIKIVQRILSSD